MSAKKITAAVLAVGMFAAVAGCSSDDSDSASGNDTSQPFRISFITSQSGMLAPFAAAVDDSIDAAIKEVNAGGGILGRTVEITRIDDGSDSTKAVNAAQSIVAGGTKPDIVIPGLASMTTIPVLPIFAKAEIPTVTIATATAGNDPEKYPYNFGVSNTPSQSIVGLVNHLKDDGIKSIAAVTANNEAGKSTLDSLEAAAKDAGISITGTQALDATTVDATAALSKLKADNPDALVVPGIQGPLAGTIFKDRVKLDWDVPAFTDVVTTANDLISLAGGEENLKGVTLQEVPFAVTGDPLQDTEAFKKFKAGFLAEEPNPTLPLSVLGAGWGAISFIQGVFDKAGESSADAYQKAALDNLKTADAPLWFNTPGPEFGFTPDNHYTRYGTYAYAPVGPRDELGSLLPPTASGS